MKKSMENYAVFVGMFMLGLVEAVSGFVLWLALPQGSGGHGVGRLAGGVESTFWSLSRHTWIDIHDWVAVAIMAVIVIHLALHWKWMFYMTKKLFQPRKLASQAEEIGSRV